MNAFSQRNILTALMPAIPRCCCLNVSAPYWSNPPFLIFDIRARTERQCARMSKIKNGGLDQYGKVYSLNGISDERVELVKYLHQEEQ